MCVFDPALIMNSQGSEEPIVRLNNGQIEQDRNSQLKGIKSNFSRLVSRKVFC